jgi:prepilin-type processing-associated H-X9-DG protein
MLLPALNKARQQAKVVACGSQERQIAMALLMYAGDNKGWFPKTRWASPQGFIKEEGDGGNSPDFDNPSSITPYLKTSKVLWCPAQSDGLPAVYYHRPGRYIGSYEIIAAHASRPYTTSSSWYGWIMYTHSTGANDYRAPIPNVNWTGRSITDPQTTGAAYRTQYIDTADQQPMVMDCFDPTDGTWDGWNQSDVPNNHYGLGGENIAFVDGHVEWRKAKVVNGALAADSQIKYRFEFYGKLYW